MRQLELQTGKWMTDPATPAQQTPEALPHVDLGMSITIATTITVVSAILVAGATYEVIRGTLSSGMTRLLAVVSLLSLVAMFYGLIELALAVIATTAERRRQARAVSERRHGDRARKPTPH
jgi:NAD/NADP transhydrogenase beta subunit